MAGACLLLAAASTYCRWQLEHLIVPSAVAQEPAADAQADAQADAAAPPAAARVQLVPVLLPITGDGDTRVKRMIDQMLAEVPAEGARPVLVLEFRGEDEQAGEASQYERCLSLARYLASEPLSRVRTVAYLPSSVKGHAVLVALACEEIIMDGDAEFGAAGIGEGSVDATVRLGYREIVNRRRTMPVPFALGMLDRSLEVLKVQTLDGVRYVLSDELPALQQSTTVSSVETVVAAGDYGVFRGRELRLKYGFVSHLASDRVQLASVLGLPPQAIEEDPSLGGSWRAVRVELKGPITGKTINWVQRSIEQKVRSGQVNFLCLWISSPGGSPADSVRLASYLADLDPARVRTVAYVPTEARGDAALIALACDHLVMIQTAVLGGPGAREMDESELADLRVAVQALADAKQRDWSLAAALVDSELTVYAYRHEVTGRTRYYTAEEFEQRGAPDGWQRGQAVETAEGVSGREAESLGLARFLVNNFDELRQLYHLEEALEPIEPNWAHMLIERLASPKFAAALLFVAWFALMVEFMSPGVGVAGFVSGICFLLFFWSNYLHGTAGWLEVLLFLAGVACVLLEILVLPGIGVFGIGGGLMIVCSLVLASQTFVIPRNSYQLGQLPGSLFVVFAACAGAVVSLVALRRYLPEAPLFNRMMLAPPDDIAMEELQRREALVDYNHLLHKRGRTTTRLTPAGKARFGDELVNVISDGELIAPGTDVYVADVQGNHVLVRPIEG